MTWLGILRIAEPRRYLLAMSWKNIAEWVFYGAAGWVAASSLSSPAAVSVVMTASFVPTIPGSLLGGWLIDRKPPNAVLRSVLMFAALPSCFLLAIYMLGWTNLSLLYAAVFLQGASAVVLNPIRWASYQMVASEQNRPYLLAADTLQWEAGKGAGIYIAGAGLQYSGAPAVLTIGMLFSALAVLAAARLRMERDSRRSEYTAASFKEFLSGGMWILKNKKKVMPAMLLGGTVWAMYAPLVYLLPSVASDMLGQSSAGFGLLGVFLGAGGAAGGIVSSWSGKFGNRWAAVFVSVLSMVAGFWLLASAENFVVACAGTAVCGSVPGFVWTILYMDISEHVETGMKGRVFGAWGAIAYGMVMPVWLLVSGVLSGGFGLRGMFAVLGSVLLVALCALTAWRIRCSRDMSVADFRPSLEHG